MNFNDMSIKALRAYAKENGIKLQSATKKSDIVAILTEATEDTAVVENNVVASKAEQAREREDLLEREVPDNTPQKNDQGVIVYSERRYSSSKLGKLDLGYNIVKENLARYWVRLPDVRIADADELRRATDAGVKPGELIGPKGRRM
jgi:hypothetical protein